MSKFRVGVIDGIIAARPTATTFTTGNYLTAVASRADSFWVPDHLNALFPRCLWNEKFCAAARIVPTADAYPEPWTMLGHLSARTRLARLHLGVAVTDTGRRNLAVTAQAAATLHLLTRGRAILGIGTGERQGNQPYGVEWSKPVARFEEAMATIRALWDSAGELVNRESPYFPLRNTLFDLPPYRGNLAADLDRGPRSTHAARRGPLRGRLFPSVPLPPRRLCPAAGDGSCGSLRRRPRPPVDGAGGVPSGRRRAQSRRRRRVFRIRDHQGRSPARL